jgi:hypothetical protein
MPIFDIIRSDHYRSEAEIQVEGHDSLVSYSAKGDNGLSIGRVRCSRKTGRWLITHMGNMTLCLTPPD